MTGVNKNTACASSTGCMLSVDSDPLMCCTFVAIFCYCDGTFLVKQFAVGVKSLSVIPVVFTGYICLAVVCDSSEAITVQFQSPWFSVYGVFYAPDTFVNGIDSGSTENSVVINGKAVSF